jgi:hypothetical protein
MSQTDGRYDSNDPRLTRIIKKYDKRYGPEPTKDTDGLSPAQYLSMILRTFDAPNRRGQSPQSSYHEAIEAFAKDKTKDSQIVFQDADWTPIKTSQVKANLDLEPSGWVHFVKVDVEAKSTVHTEQPDSERDKEYLRVPVGRLPSAALQDRRLRKRRRSG